METLSEADTRRMYSWWWDSHISPKNSKWLQENLTDMDAKVKAMIKVIEEDADSFARRAEMYYKKRPELMKLVEEFYRAYRALAERYDHATGVLRQAHRTMAEAFPNQVPFVLADDSPGNSASEADLHTPELSPNTSVFLEPDSLQKDALGLSSSHFHAVKRKVIFNDDSDSVTSRKGLSQVNDLFGSGDHAKFTEEGVRNSPNFEDAREKEQNVQGNDNYALHPHTLSESEGVNKSEKEILILKEALSKLEAEKESGLIKYQQCLEKLSKLESEVSRAQEDSKGLNERANQAEYEIQNLKEALAKLEAEKKASLLQYQKHLEMISKLENVILHAQEDARELNERVNKAETEAQTLRQNLATVEAEKDVALDQYKQSLEMISELKDQLLHAEEDYRKINERAVKAENEVEAQKEVLAKLIEEKDAAALEYQQCLETISKLERKIFCMQDEAQRLNGEIDNGAAKLKHAEELCLLLERSNESLHNELESLTLKMSSQSEDLSEKQKELGRLWTCLQEERLRFMEAETAFQTLQRLHAQTQDELRSLSLELQNRTQISRDMEAYNQSLQDQIQKIKEENNKLSEINLSSATSMKDMQDELLSLRKTNGKLEEEMELRLDQRNALQQEIYCLKEELLELNKRYRDMLEQVTAVGLNADCFELSVKKLQDDNSNLNETCQRERSEKVALSEKLEVMGELLLKNAFLENSLSNLSAKLEGAKGEIKALKESCEILSEEKSTLANEKATLIAQLQLMSENLDKQSAKNLFLEDSILEARDELELLKAKSTGLEHSCQVLDNENSGLINEMNNLASQLEITQQKLKVLESRFTELEEKCSCLEKEKQSTLCKVEELRVSLDVEKPKDITITELSETWLAGMETTIHLLQGEIQRRKRESEEELYRTVDSQIEVFILQRCIQDLKEKNLSLLMKHQKVLETSKFSEKLISQLRHENLEKQVQMKYFFDQTNKFSEWMYQLLMAVDIDVDHGREDKIGEDQAYLDHMISKLEDVKIYVCKTQDENQQLMVEMSILVTLLEQLRLEAANLKMERNMLDQELKIKTEQLSVVQNDTQKLFGMGEELRLKVKEGNQKEEALTTLIENLRKKLSDSEQAYENLQQEHIKVLEEKWSLTKGLSDLEEKNHNLNEENLVMFGDFLSLSNLCLILKNFIDEKSVELKILVEGLDNLEGANIVLKENLGTVRGMLEAVQMENSHLKESFQNSMDELKAVAFVNDQLNREIANEKILLHSKEKELSEVGWKLCEMENERSGLLKIVEDLKRECKGACMIKENQEKQIFELTEERDRFSNENECLCEVKCRLDVELHRLHEELKKSKTTEERLCFELQNGKNDVNMWETEATALFSKLQFSTVYQVLFEEKVNVLMEAYESLKSQSASKNIEAELHKERISAAESENGLLRAQLASYFSAVAALRECITSLENHPCLRTKSQKSDNKEAKDPELVSYQHVSSCPCEDQSAVVQDAFADLQDLQSSIKAIEMAVIEMERVAMQENMKANAKLEAAMRKIEELRSKRSAQQENAKPVSEISEVEKGLPTKDIMLDQISECSSHGMSRREHVEADPQMLELWETADHDCSIDLTVGKAKSIVSAPTEKDIGYHKIELAREQKGAHTNSEVQAEEEVSVDKLEISKKPTESSPKGNERKILERLNSDIQKLTNLRITVQDLKRKVEITENRPKGKAIVECDTVKGELEEAEEAIQKLFNLNGKLMKSIEEGTFSDGKPAMETEDSRSSRRKKVSEQARRLSEKIGRLQLDIQKIQFVLLRVDERESKVRTRIPETKRRVLLQDYLYGGVRTFHRQKKASCCACVQPPTKGD